MANSVAVVYLARSVSGSSADFVQFAKSYRQFDAGIPHDLIVIHKGAARRAGTREAIAQLFDGIAYRVVEREDTGFDIPAYLAVARQVEHDYVCFLNTFSEICAADWLAKLMQPFAESETVGATGATASYESLYSSIGLITKVVWMCNAGIIPFDETIATEFAREISQHAPQWMALRSGKPTSAKVDMDTPAIRERFARYWQETTRVGGPLSGFQFYKPFPNPHLRSNAFVVSRPLLNEMGFTLDDSKADCNRFESGIDGFPTRLAQRGLDSVLVGADGRSYPVERWADSDGFRLGEQSNILIRDNQVRAFEAASPDERERLSRLAWGAYAHKSGIALLGELGFPHDKGNLCLTHGVRASRPPGDRPLVLSIVIPTRNRRSLLLDALHTVIGQAYPHWECVVFDNHSDEPLAPDIEALGDPRIRCVRSDAFLPVTDSWNRAIDEATGDYITLIGDDDGLTPDFMSSIEFMVRQHERPDFVYTSLFQFFHPGVAPWELSGYLIDLRYGEFFEGQSDFAKLDVGAAQRAVIASLDFKRSFAFNMQAFSFAKPFLDSIRHDGLVFHSPFPDYYLANVAMALGKVVTVAPKPLAIAGVSRSSFGYMVFNKLEAEGAKLLQTDLERDPLYPMIKQQILPGPVYNTNYLFAMHHVKAMLGDFTSAEVGVARYRRWQILSNLFPDAGSTKPTSDSLPADLLSLLDDAERTWAQHLVDLVRRAASGLTSAAAELGRLREQVSMYDRPAVTKELDIGSFANVRQCFDAMASGWLIARTNA